MHTYIHTHPNTHTLLCTGFSTFHHHLFPQWMFTPCNNSPHVHSASVTRSPIMPFTPVPLKQLGRKWLLHLIPLEYKARGARWVLTSLDLSTATPHTSTAGEHWEPAHTIIQSLYMIYTSTEQSRSLIWHNNLIIKYIFLLKLEHQ